MTTGARLVAIGVLVVASCGDPSDAMVGTDSGMTGGLNDGGTGGTGGTLGALYKSGTRIKMRVGNTADGSKEFRGWFDTQRNEACVFRVATDGKTRCLPQSFVAVLRYADTGCTMPLAEVAALAPACGGTTPAAPKYTNLAASCPPYGNEIRQLGAVFSGTMVSIGGPGQCSQVVRPSGVTLYSTGAPIDPGQFVEQTESVE
jgi:hypothetical protein